MNERYIKLFTLQENLYVETSPVVISAGALLKDNKSEKILVQLKIKNISNDVIKAVKISIEQFDTAGNLIDTDANYEYLDLSVERNSEFGQKNPIVLKNKSTRSVKIKVEKVVFLNNKVWDFNGGVWEPLVCSETLETLLNNDAELVKQYKLEYGTNCQFVPAKDRDLWICSCGTINNFAENECYGCKASYTALNRVDVDALNSNKLLRLEKEKQEQEKAKAEFEIKKKNIKKKMLITVAVSVVLLIVSAIAFSFISKNSIYNSAVELREAGEYELAIETFEGLGDFKDSSEQILLTKYDYAIDLIENNLLFETSINLLEELGDFKDSRDVLGKLKAKKYNEGIGYLEKFSTFDTAKGIFEVLEDYKDSKKILEDIGLLEDAFLYEAREGYEFAKQCRVDYGFIGESKERLKMYSEFTGIWKENPNDNSHISVYIYWNGIDEAELSNMDKEADGYGVFSSSFIANENSLLDFGEFIFEKSGYEFYEEIHFESGKLIYIKYEDRSKTKIIEKSVYNKM